LILQQYSQNEILATFSLIVPWLLSPFCFNSSSKSSQAISILFIVGISFLNSLRRGGGDLFNYLQNASFESCSYTFAEPFYIILERIRCSLFLYHSEFFISACLFLVSFTFYFILYLFFRSSRFLIPILFFSYVFFGPSLPQAQLRLTSSISFAWFSRYCFYKKNLFSTILFFFLALVSHNISLIILISIYFLPSFSFSKIIAKLAKGFVTLGNLFTLSLSIIASLFLITVVLTNYDLIQTISFDANASSNFVKNTFFAFSLLFLFISRSVDPLPAEGINLRLDKSIRLFLPYLGGVIFFEILSPFGWLSRLRFLLYPAFCSLILRNHSKLVFFILVFLFTLRNLNLYLQVDPNYLLFL